MRVSIFKFMTAFALAAFPVHCTFSAAQNLEGHVSPLYFGPNALPVPDMIEGKVSPELYTEITSDFHKGFRGDRTWTISAKVNIPLFSPRVNLSLWMPVTEFYSHTPESLSWQNPLEPQMKGCEAGNVYISTDIQILRESTIKPDFAIRAALITASGNDEHARYFDAPGYFFDGSISKSASLSKEGFFKEIRLTASGGFLCWQTEKGGQNDAYMYGVKATLSTQIFNISATWQGYSGWQGNGDCPMVVRADAVFKAGNFRPLLRYEYGVRDFPYHGFRFGLGYVFTRLSFRG